MRFLHGKTANKLIESNLCLPNDTSPVSEKQNYATTITEISGENHPGKRNNRNPDTTQKVTDAELLHQLEKVDAQLEEAQRESEDCEDVSYCKILVPIMNTSTEEEKTNENKNKSIAVWLRVSRVSIFDPFSEFVSLMIKIIKINFVDCVHTYYNLFVVILFLLALENKTKQT